MGTRVLLVLTNRLEICSHGLRLFCRWSTYGEPMCRMLCIQQPEIKSGAF
jgi:hypothetical protein